MSYDIPSISELEAIQLLNKHYAEVVTSKKDGIASGSDITQTTNPITGVVRRTLYKILDDMDDTFLERLLKMTFTPVGTFTSGATLTDARQILLWEVSEGGDGHYYSWSGTFPKAVTAGSSPSPIEAGSWVDRTDDSLRDEIRETVFQNMKRLAAEAGFNLVDGSFEEGAVISGWPDVVWSQTDGKYYQWYLDEAKTVPAGSTPAGGVGAWSDKTDLTLRSDILAADGFGRIGSMSYAQLRAYSGTQTTVNVCGINNVFDGAFGVFSVNTSDTTSADNGGTILVDASGRRWYRRYSGDVTVRWFGATGDGVTDDTAAIQKAIDYVYSIGKPGTVVIPQSSAEYIFTSILVKTNITLKSTGGVLKLKSGTCSNSGTTYYLVNNMGHTNVTYDALIIDGNKANNTLFTVADAITAVGAGTVVRNCKINNPPDSGIMFSDCTGGACVDNYVYGATDCGIYCNGSPGSVPQHSIVSGNRIDSCSVTGIAIKRSLNNILVDSNSIRYCANGISHEDFGTGLGGHPSNVTITNNAIYSATSQAMVLNRLTNSVVANNAIRNASSYVISVSGGVNSTITGNMINGSGSETSSNSAIHVFNRIDPGDSSYTTPKNLVIANNSVNNYLGNGLYVQTGSSLTISGNSLIVSGEGLRLDADVSGALIQQNVIDGGTDLSLYSGAVYLLKDNVLSGSINGGYVSISAGQVLPNNAASTIVPAYIGQEVLHLAENTWWKSYGTAATQWIQIG